MELKFRHVDVRVKNLDEACAYYAQILKARISKTLVWERGGLHVHYAIALIGQERFMLVQPLAGLHQQQTDSVHVRIQDSHSGLNSGLKSTGWCWI